MFKSSIYLALLLWSSDAVIQNVDFTRIAQFENFNEYFPNLMQETVYELEKYGWSNFKLSDRTLNIDEEIYDRKFQGHVNYTNGFLASIQHLDFTDGRQVFSQWTNNFTYGGQMLGVFKLHIAEVGYDVSADLGELGIHKFTGTFQHNLIQFLVSVEQNLNTSDISVSVSLSSLSGITTMTYLPDTDIGEVLSRSFINDTWDAAISWARDIIEPIITQIISRSRGDFPKVCFNC